MPYMPGTGEASSSGAAASSEAPSPAPALKRAAEEPVAAGLAAIAAAAEEAAMRAPSLMVPQVVVPPEKLAAADEAAAEEEPPDWGGDDEEVPTSAAEEMEVEAESLAEARPKKTRSKLSPYHIKTISKKACQVLRHRPELLGTALDEVGRAPFNCFVKYSQQRFAAANGFDVTEEDILHVLASDDKGRYRLWYRREDVLGENPSGSPVAVSATQGHSHNVGVKLEKAAVPLTSNSDSCPPVLCHGTTVWALMKIMEHGIRPMGRPVHLATKSLADASLKAGVRENIEVGIYLDLERIRRAIDEKESVLYLTAAETILCDTVIPFAWVKRVERARDGVNLFRVPSRFDDAIRIPNKEWYRCRGCDTWLVDGCQLCPNLFNCGIAQSQEAFEQELQVIPRWKRQKAIEDKYKGAPDYTGGYLLGKDWYTPPPSRRPGGNTDHKNRVKRAIKMKFRGPVHRFDTDAEYRYNCGLSKVPRVLYFDNGNPVEPDER